MKLPDDYRRALLEFGLRVHAISPGQWDNDTPCTEWSVRDLVNHLVVEQMWVPPLLAGATLAEVGDRFDGDQLGADQVGAWDLHAERAYQAFAARGALSRIVRLSYGPTPARDYCTELVCDLVVHAWDLARGIDTDDALDGGLVDAVDRVSAGPGAGPTAGVLFATPVRVSEHADRQTKVLARYGRRR